METEDDFLAAVEADNVNEPVIEAAPEPVVETPQAPAEPEAPVEQPQTLTPPVLDHRPEPGFVPISVVLDERDKRKALEAQVAQFQRQVPQQAPQAPDMLEDPEGYTQHIEQRFEAARYSDRLHFSEQMAIQRHGEDTVKTAMEWGLAKCDSDPLFNAKVRNSIDPVGTAVQEYQRDQIASTVTPDAFAEFQAWKQAQAQLTQQQIAAPAAPTTPAIPPRSLASAPSAGGITTEIAQSDDEIFAETFSRK